MQFNSSIARAAMTALFIGASAQATIINEFTDLTGWTAATTSGTVVTQTFASVPGSITSVSSITAGSVIYAGFYNENSGGGNDTYVWSAPSAGFQTGTGAYIMGGSISSFLAGNGTANTGIRATLNSLSGITALAFNFSAFRFSSGGVPIYSAIGAPIVLQMDLFENGIQTGTRSLTVPVGSLGLGFMGFTTTGNITGIKLYMDAPTNTDANRIVLDNFAYASAAGEPPPTSGGGEIPEPSTYLLCAVGLLGAAFLRRRSA